MLTKSIFRTKAIQGFNTLRCFSAVPEYDLAVIGGGPGGKYLETLII